MATFCAGSATDLGRVVYVTPEYDLPGYMEELPFYERGLFWGLASLVAAAVLTAAGFILPPTTFAKWLLVLAWLVSAIPLWLACNSLTYKAAAWFLVIVCWAALAIGLDSLWNMRTIPQSLAATSTPRQPNPPPVNHPLPSPKIPSGYIQTFTAGDCDQNRKPLSDESAGLFSELEGSEESCQRLPGGPREVVNFTPFHFTAAHAIGITPRRVTTMVITLYWITIQDEIDKQITWALFLSCGKDATLKPLAFIEVPIGEPQRMPNNTEIQPVESCRPGERYDLRIGRDDQQNASEFVISLYEAQVDFR